MIGGLGVQELLVIFIIALVIFGGKRLPEIGRNLGQALRGFKDTTEKTMEELKRENPADAGSEATRKETREGAGEQEQAAETDSEPDETGPDPEETQTQV